MFARLFERASYLIRDAVDESVDMAKEKLRELAATIALLQLAVATAWLSIFAFAASLFFNLSNLDRYILPAVYTGILALVLAAFSAFLALKRND